MKMAQRRAEYQPDAAQDHRRQHADGMLARKRGEPAAQVAQAWRYRGWKINTAISLLAGVSQAWLGLRKGKATGGRALPAACAATENWTKRTAAAAAAGNLSYRRPAWREEAEALGVAEEPALAAGVSGTSLEAGWRRSHLGRNAALIYEQTGRISYSSGHL